MGLDASDGSIVFRQRDAVAAPDWSSIVTTQREGPATVLSTLDPTTGAQVSSLRIHGNLDVRVVSEWNHQVALMAPLPKGTSPWTPVPRAETTITVAESGGSEPVQRFHLKGNYEPEAFSIDGESLFLIQYLPALHPTSYRVGNLYLEKGKVWQVAGRNKTWLGKMSGTRLSQVVAPAGDRVYTLYSNQPPEYAQGFDPNAKGKAPVAFIHTLSTAEGWAFCVPLPRAFGSSPASAEAIAVDPHGTSVYAVDAAAGLIADIDTESLKVTSTAHVDLGPIGDGTVTAAVSPDGTMLYVGSIGGGADIIALDTATLSAQLRWSADGLVSDLILSADGSRLYATERDSVRVFDPETGQQIGSIAAPGAQGIGLVASIA